MLKKIGHSGKILVHWFLENISSASAKSLFLMDVVNQTREKSCSQSTPHSTHAHTHMHTHMHTHVCTHTHAHTHMHTHTHSLNPFMCEPGNHLCLQTERVKMLVCFGLVSRRNQEKKTKDFLIRCLLLI